MDVRSHIRQSTCTTAADAPALPPPRAFLDAFWNISFQSTDGVAPAEDDTIISVGSVVQTGVELDGASISSSASLAAASSGRTKDPAVASKIKPTNVRRV